MQQAYFFSLLHRKVSYSIMLILKIRYPLLPLTIVAFQMKEYGETPPLTIELALTAVIGFLKIMNISC